MKKNSIVIISVASVLLLLVGWYYYHLKTKAIVYYWRSVAIEKGDVIVLVTATGSMAADTSVDVGVQVSGIIAKIKTDFNAIVRKGQIIAVLDTTLYAAAKADAVAALQRSKVAMEQAKNELNRAKLLIEQKVIAQADYELASTTFQTAKSNLISAQAQVNRAEISLRYCTIKAPISGMVIARNVQVGNMVIASFNSPVLFTIVNNLKKCKCKPM